MRTVIAFELLGTDRVIYKLVDAPTEVDGLGNNDYIDISPLAGEDVMQRGRELCARLVAHPPVRTGVERALGVPPGGTPAPLYFHIKADGADALPWEQLYASPHGFCALDRRWPVGRIARTRREVADRPFQPPFRIVAVLSAAGRSGMAQLEALVAAAGSDDAAGIDARLHVITGQEALYEKVNALAQQNVTAQFIGASGPLLQDQIARARPHVLHLLGHGGMIAGVPTLAFAAISDFDADATTGSVRLALSQVVDSLAGVNPWLVVLNACDSANAIEGQALAHDLASAGIPAVIGMRRLVDINDADQFCANLYPEVLAAIRAAVDPAGPPGVRHIDWASTLTRSRMALSGMDPAAVDTWSDPVLYVQEARFQTYTPGGGLSARDYARLRGELDVWEGYLRQVERPDPAVKAKVQQHITRLHNELARADE